MGSERIRDGGEECCAYPMNELWLLSESITIEGNTIKCYAMLCLLAIYGVSK